MKNNTPNETTERERQAFEAWHTKQYISTEALEWDGSGYSDFDHNRAWKAWQASRSTLPQSSAEPVLREAVENHLASLDAYDGDLVPINRTRGTASELRAALEKLRKMCAPRMSHQEDLMIRTIDEALSEPSAEPTAFLRQGANGVWLEMADTALMSLPDKTPLFAGAAPAARTFPPKLTPAMRDAVYPKWTYSPDTMYSDLLESLPPAPLFCGLCRQPVSLCGCVPTSDGPGQPDAAQEVEIDQKGNEP